MTGLSDFLHLPQLDLYIEQIDQTRAGLILIAGPGSPPERLLPDQRSRQDNVTPRAAILPSGRSLIFSILLQSLLEAHPQAHALVITQDKDGFRLPRALKGRVAFGLVDAKRSYQELIEQAAARTSGLLVVDNLQAENMAPTLEAARKEMCVLTQLDTLLQGAAVARQMADWGASPQQLEAVAWVLSVQRVQTLCPRCKTITPPDDLKLHRLRRAFPHLFPDGLLASGPDGAFGEVDLTNATYYQAPGCDYCHGTGSYGDIAAFDVLRGGPGSPPILERDSRLPIGEYLVHLAALGHLSLSEALDFPNEQLRRAYYRMAASERATAETQVAMQRKLAELEAANRVTTQRTSMLISLHDISQTLISSTDLDDLAVRVCRHAREICGAERSIFYYQRSPNQAEVLAVSGWSALMPHQPVDPAHIAAAQPRPYALHPPGAPPVPPGQKAEPILTGLLIPLIAQEHQVGALLVQAFHKQGFTPGEVATLQTLAGQAALAIQRAGLIAELRQKIEMLEAAQAELVKKERMERELELAHQVQLSLLPRSFPQAPGYSFIGRCEPARQVGGDFYDAFWIDEHRIGLAIADVSDKGLAAALFMALCRSLLLAEARRDDSPSAVLTSVNRLLLELVPQQMFVSLFYAVMDTQTQHMTYTRAGHERPLLLRGGSIQPLPGNGVALGVFENPVLQDAELELQPGDRLVMYTDGLTDVMSPDEQRFELHRLEALLSTLSHLPADQLCTEVFGRLAAYQAEAEQFDDMTLLMLEIV